MNPLIFALVAMDLLPLEQNLMLGIMSGTSNPGMIMAKRGAMG